MTSRKVKTISIAGSQDLVIREDEPLGWFEDLYAASDTEGQGVPWASMNTHPLFAQWLDTHDLDGTEKSALVVGCGMGDDAVELKTRGFVVTAFDVSHSAINYCKRRFPDSGVDFLHADLFDPPAKWTESFDFVLEIYTVQAVPPIYEEKAIRNIAQFVAPSGQLLVIAEVGVGQRSFENGPPWLLTPQHVDSFVSHNLSVEDQHVAKTTDEGGTSFVTTLRK